ncbi:MAG: nucleoside 2-deoxyribosyltransferase [Candidatus Marsarchaeota archaeon]|nr:nucleoside 2-deoxyribosyltransferase [Candidatus Marsarchaeota archaeon]MCL5418471.1 nucleoside 2-deoxyribosyltransferase [Candidatus Marsarchaeota archaeon]
MGKLFIGNAANVVVYLASPLGFTEEGRVYIRDVLLPKIEKIEGVAVIDPWSSILRMDESQIMHMGVLDAKESERIGNMNFKSIGNADVILANLNGADPDSGTCIEIGHAHALGKTIIGYRTDFRRSGDSSSGVNLQVEAAIYGSGGKLFGTLDGALDFLKGLVAEKASKDLSKHAGAKMRSTG